MGYHAASGSKLFNVSNNCHFNSIEGKTCGPQVCNDAFCNCMKSVKSMSSFKLKAGTSRFGITHELCTSTTSYKSQTWSLRIRESTRR